MPLSKKTVAKGDHVYVRIRGKGSWVNSPKVFADQDDKEVMVPRGTTLKFDALSVRVNGTSERGEWLHAPTRSCVVTYEERDEPGIVVITSWSAETHFGKKTYEVGKFIPLKDLARNSAVVVKTPA